MLSRSCRQLFVYVFLMSLQVREGLYYNPYFPGGALAMPRMLADGGVEYDDGTPSNSSQQAKVCGRERIMLCGGVLCVCVCGPSADTC